MVTYSKTVPEASRSNALCFYGIYKSTDFWSHQGICMLIIFHALKEVFTEHLLTICHQHKANLIMFASVLQFLEAQLCGIATAL